MFSPRSLVSSAGLLLITLTQANYSLNFGEEKLLTVTYKIDDLVSKNKTVEELVKMILTSVDSAGWEPDGANSLEVIEDKNLEIRTTASRHKQIDDLLIALRQLNKVNIDINVNLFESDRDYFEKEISSKLKKGMRFNDFSMPFSIDKDVMEQIQKRCVKLQSHFRNAADGETLTVLSRRRAFAYKRLSDSQYKREIISDVLFESEIVNVLAIAKADRRAIQLQISEDAARLRQIERVQLIDPRTGKETTISKPFLLKTKISIPVQIKDNGIVLLLLQLPFQDNEKAKNRVWFITLESKIKVKGENFRMGKDVSEFK